MPRPLVFLLSLALGAGIAVVLVSCGGDDEDGTIPPDNASAMLQDLEDAQAEQDTGDCEGLAGAAGNLVTEIENLPDTVDPEVRTALTEGAQNLQNQAGDESKCEPATGTTGPQGAQTTEDTTTTEPPITDTTTTTTTTEPEKEKPPKEPKPPSDEGDEDEGGGPPATPPGQGGQPPGQSEGPPESGGVGGGDDNGG